MRRIFTISLFLLLLFPVVASAQTIGDIMDTIFNIVDYAIVILMSVATIVFLWGIIKYIGSGADEKAKEASKGIIKAGIIGLFLMVAIWGIVKVLTTTFLGPGEFQGIPRGPGYKEPGTE